MYIVTTGSDADTVESRHRKYRRAVEAFDRLKAPAQIWVEHEYYDDRARVRPVQAKSEEER